MGIPSFFKKVRKNSAYKNIKTTFLITFLIYLFLVAIELLGVSLKGFGVEFAKKLIQTTSNPFLGLLIGILATSIVQSSSATTSIIVGFVAGGTLTIPNAIPMVMGANIGTSITNTIVSMAHVGRKEEFRKAFPAATVHDMFNLLSVAVFLPLEIKFHLIQKVSFWAAEAFGASKGMHFNSPLKAIVKPAVNLIITVIHRNYIIGASLGFILILVALKFIVDVIRASSKGKMEVLVDGYLFSSPISAWLLGLGLTAFVQSSSITTSIVIPLAAAGIVSIEQIFPYTLGANIGTTLTALLASFVTGSFAAVQIALSHFLFNVFGTMVWYPLRKVPISMAKGLGEIAMKKRYVAIIYIITVFFIIPILFLFLFRR